MTNEASKSSLLKQRALDAINADRMSPLYKDMELANAGCVILSLSEVYKFYFPNIPLPRSFEETVRKTFPDLETTNIGHLPIIINNLNLGFEVTEIIIEPGINIIFHKDNQSIKSKPFFKQQNSDYFYTDHQFPFILIMRGSDDYHAIPFIGRPTNSPFESNSGGQKELSDCEESGYKKFAILKFKKSEENN